MKIAQALTIATAKASGTLSVFALQSVDAALFDKLVEQVNVAPRSQFVMVALSTLTEKRDGGYLLSERTQELYELLCGKVTSVH